VARRRVSCLLLLGGNLGDRRKNLAEAVRLLARLPGTRIVKKSRVYETAPVGPAKRRYLNMAVEIRTALSPMGLLIECKRVEALLGRKPAAKWTSRTMDVDVIRYGAHRSRSPFLKLPHPLVSGRAFALAPLEDIAPSWRPLGRLTVSQLLKRLAPSSSDVRLF
jgi:2-amino-4-hydroxy-6-hydroxymethyldihydropteridine diphosphokinase